MSTSMESRNSVPVFELSGQLGAAEFTDYLAILDRCLDGLSPFAMVIDGSALMAGLDQAPRGAWPRIRATRLTAFHKGVAFVTGTGTSSDRVRALCAMQPPGIPYAFFNDLEEAMAWAQGQLDGTPVEKHNRHKTVSLMSVGGL